MILKLCEPPKLDGSLRILVETVEESNPRPGGIFTSFRRRLLSALEAGTADQRIALGISYDRGYSKASRSIHSNIGDPLFEITEQTIDAQIGRVGMLSAHIVVCAYSLLGVEPSGIAAQLKSTLHGTDAATKLHAGLCTDFKVGDVVFAYVTYFAIIIETAKSKYGYTSCKVRYLTEPPLQETPEDWFSSPYIKMILPKENLFPLLKDQLGKYGGEKLAGVLSDIEFIDAVSGAIKEMDKAGHLKLFFKIP